MTSGDILLMFDGLLFMGRDEALVEENSGKPFFQKKGLTQDFSSNNCSSNG